MADNNNFPAQKDEQKEEMKSELTPCRHKTTGLGGERGIITKRNKSRQAGAQTFLGRGGGGVLIDYTYQCANSK